jgi:carboxypeptidase C (cathepsin A)
MSSITRRLVLATALATLPVATIAQQTPSSATGRPTAAPAQDANRSSGDSAGGSRVATAPTRDIVAMTSIPPVVQRRSLGVRGQSISYTSHSGMLPIRNNETGAIEGGMFHIAYLREGANPATRPITFVFNGGPGSSSVWLHLGAWGPKRVRLQPNGDAPPPPYAFEDNPHTLLDQTDLVFIDPIGTGYSRAASQQLGTRFWGLEEDLRSVAEFIRLYLTRYDRMASPKFLAGESYGTTRAAGLSGVLASQGITMNGVMLISTVLNFGYSSQIRGNDLGYVNFLPHYTATAWFHKRLPADLQRLTIDQVTSQAEKWAMSDYASALMKGNKLTPAEFSAVAEQMARFTGLPRPVVELNDLRVNLGTFDAELLRDQRRTVGRLDSRFTGYAPLLAGGGGGGGGGPQGPGDPSMSIIRNTFTPVFTDYARRELNYKNEDTYYILGGGIGPWNYPQNQYATVVPHLERAFAINPYMRLFVAEGYFDGATPYFASQYTLAHMSIDPNIAKNNIQVERYAAGHMMYIDEPSARKLRSDLARFYDSATRGQVIP